MGQRPLCRLALVLLASVPALSPGEDGHSLAPVIVSEAPRNAAATLTPEDETGMVRVIEREAFANRITTLADTLATQTGVQVRRLGGLGSY